MTIIACVDKRMGLSFNGKAPSRDRVIARDILESDECLNGIITNERTARYLSDVAQDNAAEIAVLPDIEAVPDGDLMRLTNRAAVIETGSPEEIDALLALSDRVILYVWDTTYPYTERFPDMDALPGWTLASEELLDGYSHAGVAKRTYEFI